jgi:hypothetical protein
LDVFAECLPRVGSCQVCGTGAAVVTRAVAMSTAAIIRQTTEQKNVVPMGCKRLKNGGQTLRHRRNGGIDSRPPRLHLNSIGKVEERGTSGRLRLRWRGKGRDHAVQQRKSDCGTDAS